MGRKKPYVRPGQRSTPAGEHRPVLSEEVLRILDPQPGQTVVDCTVGFAGHAAQLLLRIWPSGKLIGLDWDAEQLSRARTRLESLGLPFTLHHGNFAGLPAILAAEGFTEVDAVLGDLGMSSMQVDDPDRGFSYSRDGLLDMRMDRSRGKTAAQRLAEIAEADLCQALRKLGDEPAAEPIARAIVQARQHQPIARTGDLARVVMQASAAGRWQLHPRPGTWNLHPAARTFQALRLLVNRELANLDHLLRVLPHCLRAGGRAVLISFHSGEDRLIKASFRTGFRQGLYRQVAPQPVRASPRERLANPRSRSAKLRWAEKDGNVPSE